MPVPVGFFEATLIWKTTFSPQEMTTAFGIESVEIPPLDISAESMATTLFSLFTGLGRPCGPAQMIDDYQFLGVSVAKGTSTGDIIGQHFSTINGSITDASPPSNCALLINKNTASGGRRFRGRLFVPPIGLNEGAVDAAGNIASAPLSIEQARWNSVFDAMVADEIRPVLFHQGASPPPPTAITSFTVQSLIATQRRRMRR